MHIPQSARSALVAAFNHAKRQPVNEMYERPKNAGYQPVRAKPRRTVRDRKAEWMPIIETPFDAMNAKQSRTGRTNTTGKCADMIQVGHILAVAECDDQDPFVKDWLRYCYDDDCPVEVQKRVHLCLMMEWVMLDERSRAYDTGKMSAYDALGLLAMQEMRFRMAQGKERYSNAEKCEIIGLSKGHLDNWVRSWEPHLKDMLKILNAADKQGIIPIACLLHEFAA